MIHVSRIRMILTIRIRMGSYRWKILLSSTLKQPSNDHMWYGRIFMPTTTETIWNESMKCMTSRWSSRTYLATSCRIIQPSTIWCSSCSMRTKRSLWRYGDSWIDFQHHNLYCTRLSRWRVSRITIAEIGLKCFLNRHPTGSSTPWRLSSTWCRTMMTISRKKIRPRRSRPWSWSWSYRITSWISSCWPKSPKSSKISRKKY